MNVVLHTANSESNHFICPSDAGKIRPKTSLDFWCKKWLSALSTPHTMIKAACECVHSLLFCRPCGTSENVPA